MASGSALQKLFFDPSKKRDAERWQLTAESRKNVHFNSSCRLSQPRANAVGLFTASHPKDAMMDEPCTVCRVRLAVFGATRKVMTHGCDFVLRRLRERSSTNARLTDRRRAFGGNRPTTTAQFLVCGEAPARTDKFDAHIIPLDGTVHALTTTVLSDWWSQGRRQLDVDRPQVPP